VSPAPASTPSAPAGEPAPSASPALVSDARVEDGRLLYLQTCASCHGNAGEGTQYAPPVQNSGPAAHDFYLRTGRMPLGRLGSPQWDQPPQLSEEQIAALVAFASTLGDGPPIPQVVADVGSLQRGWQLYINNCAACHGATGSGGGIGSGVVAPGLGRADPLIVAEAMVVGPGAMPKFAFPQEDVNSIAAYVQHLRAEPAPGGIPLGGAGPVPEGFIAGLVGVGLLLVVVRWIGRRPSETARAGAPPARPAPGAVGPEERET
jgi:ubiquinol-cytochrome c reductase cytochrome c subunit